MFRAQAEYRFLYFPDRFDVYFGFKRIGSICKVGTAFGINRINERQPRSAADLIGKTARAVNDIECSFAAEVCVVDDPSVLHARGSFYLVHERDSIIGGGCESSALIDNAEHFDLIGELCEIRGIASEGECSGIIAVTAGNLSSDAECAECVIYYAVQVKQG